jgi:hypothetical protein
MLKVVQPDEEEAEFDHARDLAEAYADITPPITTNDPLKASAEAFSGLNKESLCCALVYEMRYGKEPVDKIVWRILNFLESIDLEMPDMDGLDQFKKILISTKTLIWVMYSLQNFSLASWAMPR